MKFLNLVSLLVSFSTRNWVLLKGQYFGVGLIQIYHRRSFYSFMFPCPLYEMGTALRTVKASHKPASPFSYIRNPDVSLTAIIETLLIILSSSTCACSQTSITSYQHLVLKLNIWQSPPLSSYSYVDLAYTGSVCLNLPIVAGLVSWFGNQGISRYDCGIIILIVGWH